MSLKQSHPWKQRALASLSTLALLTQMVAPAFADAGARHDKDNDHRTRTPIKHVIVIIGENRSFDHVFATYKPRDGEFVRNLLSEGIIQQNGQPGPNFNAAVQSSAVDTAAEGYQISPSGKQVYNVLPTPLTDGAPTTPYFSDVATAMANENGLPASYYQYMITGGTGLPGHVPDTRIPNVTSLAAGPFQLTSATLPYDAYTSSPVHRFFQMWQQLDCNAQNISWWNPAGCRNDLFPWVEVTIGAGSNGGTPHPGEGATSMGFYNMLQGDAPYLKYLADTYAMSDNYHQAVNGGTGANHIMLGTGDAMYFSDANGNPAVPPNDEYISAGPNSGTVAEIENPNPQPGSNNWYTEDGYGGGSYGSPSYGGGSYVNCADNSQPGAGVIRDYLAALPSQPSPRCQSGAYYLLNNYNPGYLGDGTNAYTPAVMSDPGQTVFTIPPSKLRNIGDELLERRISWKYYGDQWNAYVANPDLNYVALNNQYCTICNPFQYSTSIMTNAAVRTAHLQDTTNLYQDIQNGTLPAVSFVKPSGWLDGHPASSKLDLFEGFVKKIVDGVKTNPELWESTAIFVTFDEGGGYYDSGYVQPLDFFGDGTRVPLIVVSRYTKAGHIAHSYSDHVSILKFIEANWNLPPVTNRSRDNFPNPRTAWGNPYVPVNSPAIGDLMDLFNFDQDGNH